jgi:hypothetical protein
MKNTLAFVMFLLATGICGQQIKFYRTFTKPDWDYADAVIERYDGNYLMAGSSRSQNGTDYDISLILVDPLGNTIWDKYLGQSDSMEFAYSLMETSDSNYLVCGTIGMSFPYMSLFDLNGDLIRDSRYPKGEQCYGALSVGETTDHNYYFIERGPVSTLYLIDPSGDIIRSKSYDFAYCNAVIQTSDLGFMLAGHKEDQFGASVNLMIRTDQEGDTIWTKTIPVAGLSDGNSLLQLEDNGFIMAGAYNDPEMFDEPEAMILARTDSEGDTLWTKKHWMGTPIYIQECRFHSGYILSSRMWISPGGIYPDESYLFITRLDTAGNLIWSSQFDGYIYDISNNVIQTSDGGFLLTGHKEGNPLATDAILIKLDSLGDFVLSTNETEFPELSQIIAYPVPSKDVLYFRSPDHNLKIDEIRIFNSSGQEMNIIPVHSGNVISVNLSGFTTGVYFYRITTRNNQLLRGKFVVSGHL